MVIGTVWLVGITPNAKFYPIPWPSVMIFPEKKNLPKKNVANYPMYSRMINRSAELDSSELMD